MKLPPPLCTLPPEGWECSRTKGHEGPCAATPIFEYEESQLEKLLLSLPNNHPAKQGYAKINLKFGSLQFKLSELARHRDSLQIRNSELDRSIHEVGQRLNQALADLAAARAIADQKLCESCGGTLTPKTDMLLDMKQIRDERDEARADNERLRIYVDKWKDADKSLIECRAALDAANHLVDAKSNLLLNITDTLRSRGFTTPSHIDERVIAMAQALDEAKATLALYVEEDEQWLEKLLRMGVEQPENIVTRTKAVRTLLEKVRDDAAYQSLMKGETHL